MLNNNLLLLCSIRATHSIFFEKAEVRFYYLPLSARTKTSDLNHTLGASKRNDVKNIIILSVYLDNCTFFINHLINRVVTTESTWSSEQLEYQY